MTSLKPTFKHIPKSSAGFETVTGDLSDWLSERQKRRAPLW